MNHKKKPWGQIRDKNRSGRRVADTRSIREVILIACEGQATEPNYFSSFPIDPARVEIVGTGYNSDSLVELAIRKMKSAKKKNTPYNQIWCVFDRDSCSKSNISRAFQIASNHKIRIAYSNQAFELWYLLHFQFYNHESDRHTYIKELKKLIPEGYEKNLKNMYELLLDKQQFAIKFARKLESYHHRNEKYENNPSTTVYKLVETLNDFID